MPRECEEDVEFGGGEVDEVIVDPGFPPFGVDAEVPEAECVVGGGGAPTTEDGFDACGEFAWGEGFGEVVVSTDAEAGNAVGFVAAGGEDEDEDVGFGAKAGGDFHAVHAGEVEVEDDEVGVVLACEFEAGGAGGGEEEAVACLFEVGAYDALDAGFVFDDEDGFVGHGLLSVCGGVLGAW